MSCLSDSQWIFCRERLTSEAIIVAWLKTPEASGLRPLLSSCPCAVLSSCPCADGLRLQLELFLRLQISVDADAIAIIISMLCLCGTVYVYISAKGLNARIWLLCENFLWVISVLRVIVNESHLSKNLKFSSNFNGCNLPLENNENCHIDSWNSKIVDVAAKILTMKPSYAESCSGNSVTGSGHLQTSLQTCTRNDMWCGHY